MFESLLIVGLDNGSIQLIIDGKIKVKSGCEISSFHNYGLEFVDGSRAECDTVIYATGYVNINLNAPISWPVTSYKGG